jgi:hypothetical protein
MSKMIGPAGAMLVGTTFICLCIMLGLAVAEMPSNLPDLQSRLKESQSLPLNHNLGSYIVPPNNGKDLINLPGSQQHESSLQRSGSYLMPRVLPSEEKIVLNESHSVGRVSDLKTVNGIKQRDIIYDGSQNGGSEEKDLANFLDVSVTGPDRAKNDWSSKGWDVDNIEKRVDDALDRNMKNESNNDQTSDQHLTSKRLGNNMDVDVSGITVSAINTVEGGSAVATSNIIIKPVQIIVCPSEADEKLK